jgi:hypothetical protein
MTGETSALPWDPIDQMCFALWTPGFANELEILNKILESNEVGGTAI